jgi:hypothetical protein
MELHFSHFLQSQATTFLLGPYILSSTLNLCSSHYSAKDSILLSKRYFMWVWDGNTLCKAPNQNITEFLNYRCTIFLVYLKTLPAMGINSAFHGQTGRINAEVVNVYENS